MLIKHFDESVLFYKFLKERIGVFFKEAEQRAGEGIFHCVYFKDLKIPPSAVFESGRKSCVSVFFNEGKFVVCGSESKLKDFCGELIKFPEAKKLAKEILESLIRYRKQNFQLNYNRKILPLGLKTAIMGVLNVTPDSFSDGGEFFETSKAVRRAVQMVEEGAEIIDIGGESTRPGSQRIPPEEELRRVLPVLKEVRKELPDTWISIDTYKSQVARACLEEGADIINDISGGTYDPEILKVVAEYRCPYVINHVKGKPETWKDEPIIYDDVVEEVQEFFKKQINKLRDLGYKEEERIILDPGIGFGKLPEHNVEILKRFDEFKIFGKILMVGVSRKSFIGLILEGFLNKKTKPKERLFGSLGALAVPVLKGAKIVRVHDIKETREFLALLDAVRTYDGV